MQGRRTVRLTRVHVHLQLQQGSRSAGVLVLDRLYEPEVRLGRDNGGKQHGKHDNRRVTTANPFHY